MSDLRAEQLQAVRSAMADELTRRSGQATARYRPPQKSWMDGDLVTDDDGDIGSDTYEEDAYADYSVVTGDGVVAANPNGETSTEVLYDEFGEFEALQTAQQSLRETFNQLNNYLQDAQSRLGEIDGRIAYFIEHSRQVRSKVVINHVDCPCCGKPNMPMTDGTIYCNNTECGAYRPLEQ